MIEIRTFEGSAGEMHEFVVGVWRSAYTGRMTFPLWSPEYFRWQFDLDSPLAREDLLAAYDGSRLVGTLFSIPLRFHTPAGERTGSQGSWLTIHPDVRGQRIVPQLVEERVRRHQARGAALVVSYRFSGSRHSLAERPRSDNAGDPRYIRPVGFWARVLDAPRAIRWNTSRIERWMTRLGGLLQPAPRVRCDEITIRPYEPADLTRCLELAAQSLQNHELSICWDGASLGRLLKGGFGQCLVAMRDQQVQGFVAFHVLPFAGATEEPVGIIDLLVLDELSPRDQQAMINAVLVTMLEQRAILALHVRLTQKTRGVLKRTHFFPRPPDSSLVIQWVQDPLPLTKQADLQLLWR